MPKRERTKDDAVTLICNQATKITAALSDDPVDQWQDALDKMLRLYIDQTELGPIGAAIAEAHQGRGDPEAAALILERAITLGRQSASWEFAE